MLPALKAEKKTGGSQFFSLASPHPPNPQAKPRRKRYHNELISNLLHLFVRCFGKELCRKIARGFVISR